jgi:hypothetical protein
MTGKAVKNISKRAFPEIRVPLFAQGPMKQAAGLAALQKQ